jgi:hypothetical protein
MFVQTVDAAPLSSASMGTTPSMVRAGFRLNRFLEFFSLVPALTLLGTWRFEMGSMQHQS